ncbi:GGDEF domain-containing protein [Undibacterium danionis]|uniref:diguanylate cyclase n=1 Tax=Undibacterium danionis TaxID=1812100 RepID=A0ABV6IF57_9BURK
MTIDPRTIMVVWAALNILFAGMLALVGMHAGKVRGMRQWALGDLLIGISLAISSQIMMSPPLFVVIVATLTLGCGLGLLYNGIESFKGGRSRYWITAVFALIMLVNNTVFGVWYPEPKIRIASNFLLFALVHIVCARALFVQISQPLRTAYWLAAASVSVIAILALVRVVSIIFTPADSVRMFTASGVNPGVFFFASLAQMSMSFAFMLLINYTLANELKELAATDSLTGILNRRTIEVETMRQLAQIKRSGDNVAIMMIDVDHFKQINDRHGHPAGDEVLRRLAHLMRSVVRGTDYISRYGGEEFCILLPATGEKQAAALAERLRRLYSELRVDWNGHSLQSTISIGVADSRQAGSDLEILIKAVDTALYQAKHQGRNRVVGFSEGVAGAERAEGVGQFA